jgi:signal transduction histidine kinase
LLEMLIIQAIVTITYPLIFKQNIPSINVSNSHPLSSDDFGFLTFFKVFYYVSLGVAAITWVTLRWRLRPTQRPWLHQLLYETGMLIILCVELLLCVNILSTSLVHIPAFGFLATPTDFTHVHALNVKDISYAILQINTVSMYAAPIGCACAFCLLRIGVYILLLWDHLRKTHIRWALTHAHLMVIVIGAAVIYLLIIIVYIIRSIGSNQPFLHVVSSPVTSLFIIVFLLAIGIAIVLPPSALFSYIFSRRLVRRIENLAQGAGALRAGNYSVRVRVEGSDEIARLQTNFNAMATDLERTLSELKEERDNVGTLLRARRELIASVSHELRTPVATIRSYLESAIMGWQEQPPETLRQDLQVMEQQMIRLQALINDLFILSRAEVGQLEMRYQPTNIALLIKRVAETIGPIAWRGSRIEVITDITPNSTAFPCALVDENRLEQVLQNLLHNGIRHTPPGGIIILSAYAEANTIVLQVKDTGEGIAPAELSQIWERFYRAENTRNKPSSGSGLGLTIVKELTEAMGGSVAVDSVVGQGTCFTISIPQASAQETIEALKVTSDAPSNYLRF